MECPSPAWQSLPYPLCDATTLFTLIRTWVDEHPQQVALGLLGILLLGALLRWRKGTVHFRQTANQRAEQLLKRSLPPQQYQQLQLSGFLELSSTVTPGDFYRVPRYRGRVQVYETCQLNHELLYRLKAELCVIPCEDVPDADLILAHKWMIEGDEKVYQMLANWHWQPNQQWRMTLPARPATALV